MTASQFAADGIIYTEVADEGTIHADVAGGGTVLGYRVADGVLHTDRPVTIFGDGIIHSGVAAPEPLPPPETIF